MFLLAIESDAGAGDTRRKTPRKAPVAPASFKAAVPKNRALRPGRRGGPGDAKGVVPDALRICNIAPLYKLVDEWNSLSEVHPGTKRGQSGPRGECGRISVVFRKLVNYIEVAVEIRGQYIVQNRSDVRIDAPASRKCFTAPAGIDVNSAADFGESF